jgi:hypothetical protein
MEHWQQAASGTIQWHDPVAQPSDTASFIVASAARVFVMPQGRLVVVPTLWASRTLRAVGGKGSLDKD